MKNLIKSLIAWFNNHWDKTSFKVFIIFALTIIYLDIFHHADFVQFEQFILLGVLKDLVTKLAQNDAIVTALNVAIVGAIGALFRKNDKK